MLEFPGREISVAFLQLRSTAHAVACFVYYLKLLRIEIPLGLMIPLKSVLKIKNKLLKYKIALKLTFTKYNFALEKKTPNSD